MKKKTRVLIISYTAALVAALGGGDHGGTRLWWDAGRNF